MKFRKNIVTLLAMGLVALAVATSALAGKGFDPIATGSMDSGDAVIELTPSMKGTDKLVVTFSANTHSVDLSQYDIGAATTLEFDGKKIKPSKSDKLRGHHPYGKMVFDVGTELGSFKIKVVGIPAPNERVYEWK